MKNIAIGLKKIVALRISCEYVLEGRKNVFVILYSLDSNKRGKDNNYFLNESPYY